MVKWPWIQTEEHPKIKKGKKKKPKQIIRHAVVLVECGLFLGNSISKKVSKETFFPRLMTAVARHYSHL